MGYQFIHVNSYSRVSPKKSSKDGAKKWSAKDVVAEASRDPGAIPHIDAPEQPRHLYGLPLDQIEPLLEAWADGTRDARGHKARKDALCLVAGVISCPPDADQDWGRLRDRSVRWLRHKYGDRLRSVVEHTDESRPHIHFYVVPSPGEDFGLIHQGHRAMRTSRHLKKGEQNQRYKAEMRAYQAEYYKDVGRHIGLTKVGPKRERLSRAEWVQEQRRAQQVAADLADLAVRRKHIDQLERQAKKRGLEAAQAEYADRSIPAKIAGLRGVQAERDGLLERLQAESRIWQGKIKALVAKCWELRKLYRSERSAHLKTGHRYRDALTRLERLEGILPEYQRLQKVERQHKQLLERHPELQADLRRRGHPQHDTGHRLT